MILAIFFNFYIYLHCRFDQVTYNWVDITQEFFDAITGAYLETYFLYKL